MPVSERRHLPAQSPARPSEVGRRGAGGVQTAPSATLTDWQRSLHWHWVQQCMLQHLKSGVCAQENPGEIQRSRKRLARYERNDWQGTRSRGSPGEAKPALEQSSRGRSARSRNQWPRGAKVSVRHLSGTSNHRTQYSHWLSSTYPYVLAERRLQRYRPLEEGYLLCNLLVDRRFLRRHGGRVRREVGLRRGCCRRSWAVTVSLNLDD